MLHFSYGANMDRTVMRRHAPTAEPIGVATLVNYRFLITADGYASVEPAPARAVHGVLWRLAPRDRVTLDVWENVAGGLYRTEDLLVHRDGSHRPALVYIARSRPEGWPRAGYMELVVAAAREWNLSEEYLASLERWLPARPLRAGARKFQDLTWTETDSLSLDASSSVDACKALAFVPGPK